MPNNANGNQECQLHQFKKNKYFYGKLMTVQDFEAEQSYFDEKRHLINRLLHGTGIVCGFENIDLIKEDDNFKINFKDGGVALDCCGREIVVPSGTLKQVIKDDSSGNPVLVSEISATTYLYLKYKPCYDGYSAAASNPSSCEGKCCPGRIVEDFDVIASNTPPKMEAVSCPELSSASNSDEIKQKIKEWLERHYKPFSDCDTSEEKQVFLAAISKDNNNKVQIDKSETNKFITFVSVQKLLLELLSCHISNFDNPHHTDAEQVKALKTINGVGNSDPKKYVSNVQLDSSDDTITIESHATEKYTLDFRTSAAQVKALQTINGVGNVDSKTYVSDVTLDSKDKTITITPDQVNSKIDLNINKDSIQRNHFNDDVFSNLITSDDNSIMITKKPRTKQIDISTASSGGLITSGAFIFELGSVYQSTITSERIPSGFKPGPFCVVLGLELEEKDLEEKKISFGDLEAFSHLKDLEAFSHLNEQGYPSFGAQVYPTTGNFKIGVYISSELFNLLQNRKITVHWWAHKPSEKQFIPLIAKVLIDSNEKINFEQEIKIDKYLLKVTDFKIREQTVKLEFAKRLTGEVIDTKVITIPKPESPVDWIAIYKDKKGKSIPALSVHLNKISTIEQVINVEIEGLWSIDCNSAYFFDAPVQIVKYRFGHVQWGMYYGTELSNEKYAVLNK